MQTMIMTAVGLAALIAASAVSISPRGTTVTNESSIEFDLVDILKLTKNGQDLPVEEYEAIRSLEICRPRRFIDVQAKQLTPLNLSVL